MVWDGLYENYVPLKGWAEPSLEGEFMEGQDRPRVGSGFDIRGQESKRALGRTSKAGDILAHILTQYEESVIRAEKNRVGKTFLRLAQQNPNPNLWEISEKKLRRTIDKETGQVTLTPDPLGNRMDNVLAVKVGGDVFHITIHDPNLARNMKNLGAESMGLLTQALAKFNRYLAFINTSLNPEFVISNFSRDIQTAGVNLQGIDAAKGLTVKIMKDVPKALAGAYGAIRGNKQATEWQKWFREFSEEGGRISFFGMEDVKTKAKRIQKMMADARPGAGPQTRKVFREFFDFVQDINSVVENGIRLSTYANLRRNGVSKKKAASIARNLTVNFNRKGEKGPLVGALFLFYNASMQGSVRMIKALRHKRVRQVTVGIVAFHFFLDLLNAAMSPDDDDGESKYDKVNEWTKDHNHVIMNPWAEPGGDGGDAIGFKLPMPYGYNVFAVLGRRIGEVVRGKVDPMEAALGLVNVAINSFNPLGGESDILKTITPTVFKPVLELETNRDFMDNPVMPEQNTFGPPKPDSQRYWSSVSEPAQWVTEKLNQWTGGSEVRPGSIDISPETLDHFWSFLTGGTGMFVNRTTDAFLKTVQGEEVAWKDVPMVRRLVEGNNEYWTNRRYYEVRDRALLVDQEMKKLRGQERIEARENNPNDLKILGAVKMADKQLKKLREDRRKWENEDAPVSDEKRQEALDKIEARIKAIMGRVIKRYDELEEASE
jgi:hypothetical protein